MGVRVLWARGAGAVCQGMAPPPIHSSVGSGPSLTPSDLLYPPTSLSSPPPPWSQPPLSFAWTFASSPNWSLLPFLPPSDLLFMLQLRVLFLRCNMCKSTPDSCAHLTTTPQLKSDRTSLVAPVGLRRSPPTTLKKPCALQPVDLWPVTPSPLLRQPSSHFPVG